jgi:hypothetical protein
MNGSPRIEFTDTCGLVAMVNDTSSPPFVLYGSWNCQPTSNLVATTACSLDCTIPERTIGKYSLGLNTFATQCGKRFATEA